MAKTAKSVRVDSELLTELEELARQWAVPTTFADQVDAGLRLLVDQAHQAQMRRSAALVRADEDRARATYRKLRDR